jgi:hypothetical protein
MIFTICIGRGFLRKDERCQYQDVPIANHLDDRHNASEPKDNNIIVQEVITTRRFHSYGPVDKDIHFSVPRAKLVENCLHHIIGEPGKGGHYFTIWAPRQTGKTWLMHQVKERVERDYPDQFIVGTMSMQGVFMQPEDPLNDFLWRAPLLMQEYLNVDIGTVDTWERFKWLFSKRAGIFSRPVILFIDEFDSLPSPVVDRLVTLFRDVYLNRNNYLLNGLALIGVKAVLGVDSMRGSPFNIQRSLHVTNFSPEEVADLFGQYQAESGQTVEKEVVGKVFDVTHGQPGLVGWFGELLTEKYNPGMALPMGREVWETVYRRALFVELNNTVLNLLAKARGPYRDRVMDLFVTSDIAFNLRVEWCHYLYMNGIIDYTTQTDSQGSNREICRFSSPFIQQCLYDALTGDIVGDRLPIPALEILDNLSDVFEAGLNLPSLLSRYKSYLTRMKARGLNPFKDQPRRADLHYTEAVGHFHLYAWLQFAVGKRCVVSPEFPTGNGKVDIHLNCDGNRGIVEVKSFVGVAEIPKSQCQAAAYAGSLGMESVTLALFVPADDEAILDKLTTRTEHSGIMVNVVAIGWT